MARVNDETFACRLRKKIILSVYTSTNLPWTIFFPQEASPCSHTNFLFQKQTNYFDDERWKLLHAKTILNHIFRAKKVSRERKSWKSLDPTNENEKWLKMRWNRELHSFFKHVRKKLLRSEKERKMETRHKKNKMEKRWRSKIWLYF